MIYILIKSIIETTIQNYRCDLCSGTLDESHISIREISGQQMDLECTCPACKTSARIRVQVADAKQSILNATIQNKNTNTNVIKLEDIEKISLDLTHVQSVADLLK